jgi:hypothetical protein
MTAISEASSGKAFVSSHRTKGVGGSIQGVKTSASDVTQNANPARADNTNRGCNRWRGIQGSCETTH